MTPTMQSIFVTKSPLFGMRNKVPALCPKFRFLHLAIITKQSLETPVFLALIMIFTGNTQIIGQSIIKPDSFTKRLCTPSYMILMAFFPAKIGIIRYSS